MADDRPARDDLVGVLRAAADALAIAPNDRPFRDTLGIRASLDHVEAATAGGAPLHAQLDTVRKWLDVLDQTVQHERFGGEAHLRAHIITQLQVAARALEDFLRATT
jgi:hypothetical protein